MIESALTKKDHHSILLIVIDRISNIESGKTNNVDGVAERLHRSNVTTIVSL